MTIRTSHKYIPHRM